MKFNLSWSNPKVIDQITNSVKLIEISSEVINIHYITMKYWCVSSNMNMKYDLIYDIYLSS